MLEVKNIREDFPIFTERADNFVYLDSSATTLKPQTVIDAVADYYSKYSANVHRSIYSIGERQAEYEGSRKKSLILLMTDYHYVIFYPRNDGVHQFSRLCLGQGKILKTRSDENSFCTEMEHHSNIIPWQICSQETGAVLKHIPFDENGELELSQHEKLFTDKTKLVAIIHQSNVFGTINPVKDIIEMAKGVGAVTLIDAAQSVPHQKVDVQDLDCDFLAFSGHKMLGPTGVGVLYGKPEILEEMPPFMGGGEMIRTVSLNESTWNEIPWKFEAGTPNIAQAIGLGSAIDYINEIGLDKIHEHEQDI